MLKQIFAGVLTLLMATSALAQNPVPPLPTPPVPAGVTTVSGLELPPEQTVPYDEGFVSIQAKCKGEVKWLVLSNNKVKFVVVQQTNSIIISIPVPSPDVKPDEKGITGIVNVFAVGLVDGKMTEFVRTDIKISGSPSPNPGPTPPNPPPTPNPPKVITGKLHMTFLTDMDNTTPELAALLNSQTLRKTINQKGHWFRLYNINSPIVGQKKLTPYVKEVGGNNCLIIQTDDGAVVSATPIPETEQEILDTIKQLTGK